MLESSRSDNVADYRLAAVGREADEDERLSLLEQLFDPTTRRRRALVRPGWRCLEVGAGRGSIAVWLTEQVGPSGHVVATDLNTEYLQLRHEAATEAVRGGSDWARWWAVTLAVMNEQGGGDESDRREVEVMAAALADPTVWFLRELLHACWGRRPV